MQVENNYSEFNLINQLDNLREKVVDAHGMGGGMRQKR